VNNKKEQRTKYLMIEDGSSSSENSLEVLELFTMFFRSWKLIGLVVFLCILISIIFAFLAPKVYRSTTLLASAEEGTNGVSSAMGQFEGLVSMTGISVPKNSQTKQVLATLQSRRFLGLFIKQNSLMPLLFDELWDKQKKKWMVSKLLQPTEQNGIARFKEILSVEEDSKSGLITVSISWKDPELVANWANELVRQLNKQLRIKAIDDSAKRIGYLEKELGKVTIRDMRSVLYNLLEFEKKKAMLANVKEDFALEVIDPAVIPEDRSSPNRKLILLFGSACGVFLGILIVFIKQIILKTKQPKQIEEQANA
jgi:uncharacterized protein involved in exopolysaccharide biosynthesis